MPVSAGENPMAFSIKRHSSAGLSMRILINGATGRVNREDVRARLVNVAMNDVD